MASFRFLDLPREIRNKIYGILLCSFPPPESITKGTMLSKKDIHPSILRVNRQIYTESYDVMFKVNRFVLVSSTGGIHFAMMCKQHGVPTVAFDMDDGDHETGESDGHAIEPVTSNFRGYVLGVTLGNRNQDWEDELEPSELLKPCNVIVLFRDLDLLCKAIMKGDDLLPTYKENISMDIYVGLAVQSPPFQLEPPIEMFLSDPILEDLLSPFRKHIREMPQATFSGVITQKLIDASMADFSSSRYTDPSALLTDWSALKALGTQLFLKSDPRALTHWTDVRDDISTAHASPSWPRLLELGGPTFAAQTCELYYTTNLNITHLGLKWIEGGDVRVFDTVQHAYEELKKCQAKGYWGVEHDWKPTQAQKVKELVRYATILRLTGEPSTVPFAALTVEQAGRLDPGNRAVEEERRKVEAWKRVAGPVDTSAFDEMMRRMGGMGLER